MLAFAGYDWNVRASDTVLGGPGPNLFSGENVYVDESGLHLRISQRENKKEHKWYCAELTLAQPLGYGEYSFKLVTPKQMLDPQAVFSGFLYENDEREIDIEFGAAMVGKNKGQYVIQPGRRRGNVHSFSMNEMQPQIYASRHVIHWMPDYVRFESAGYTSENEQFLIDTWQYQGTPMPQSGTARMIFNLWLYQGKPALKESEVLITDFAFRAK